MFSLILALCVTNDFPSPPPFPPVDPRVVALEQEMDKVKARLDKLENKPKMVASAVPLGSHAHRMLDGSIMVHSDTNQGNAAAHAGVAPGVNELWPKMAVGSSFTTNVPRMRVGRGLFRGKVCRGGNCP